MSLGAFEWKRRMGVHLAYHETLGNRLLHWVCIPIQLCTVIALLDLVPLFNDHVRLGAAVVLLSAPVFIATEPLLGVLMSTTVLAGAQLVRLITPLTIIPTWLVPVAYAIIAVTVFTMQIVIGHNFFESGRDDTEKNLAEFSRTKNPIPLILVFYYHLVELALLCGYRPALSKEIAAYCKEEKKQFTKGN